MTADAYWDELGIAWCAINPKTDMLTSKLRARLHRQSLLIMLGLAGGFSLGIAGAALGIFTIWSGWNTGAWNFVTRGAALVAIAITLLIAALSLLPVRGSDDAKALPEMLDLAIVRAKRILFTIRLGFGACAIAAVFGLAGAAIRTHMGKPPALSPLVDAAVLVILTLGLFVYDRLVLAGLAKFRYLKRVLALDGA